MNVSDSERIASFLERHGFSPAKKIGEADLVVFNTCGIRQAAENKAYGIINNLKKQTTRNKKQIKIIMTGCLANRKDVQRRMKNSVNLFFPISNFGKFENWIIENCLGIGNWKLVIPAQESNKKSVPYLSTNPKYSNSYQALVPVMTGCNNFCSYCVVPYARGREVSRPADEIVSEIRNLIKKGYKHIVLLGQNINSYTTTSPINSKIKSSKIDSKFEIRNSKFNFSDLLRKINVIPGNFWISFVSSHPKDFSDELIKTIAKCKKVCEWIHLPIQAGNDKILEKMNRQYTQAYYLKLVKKIKKEFTEIRGKSTLISISSDIIVGFPGETKKQFTDSAKVMEKSKFDMVYFGQFSPRPGTVAWNMKDNVPKKEKARREKLLNEILKKTSFENNKRYVGKIVEVLVEKISEKKGVELPFGSSTPKETYFGKTRTMKNVKIISAKKSLLGKIIKVKVIKANVWNLEGVINE